MRVICVLAAILLASIPGTAQTQTVTSATATEAATIPGATTNAGEVVAEEEDTTPYAAKFVRAMNEYLTVADNPSISTGDIDFSLAVWANSNSSTSSRFVYCKIAAANAGEWTLVRATTRRYTFTIYNGGVSKGAVLNATRTTNGSWDLIIAVHDAAANFVRVSINGGAFTSVATTGAPADTAISLSLGSISTGGSNMDGLMALAGFWKRTLSAAEAAALYALGPKILHADLTAPQKVSLEAWWDLEEASGVRVDSQGSNDAADVNTVGQAEVVYP